MMALPAEKERYTLADVLTWDDDKRREIIDGGHMVMEILSPSTQRHDRLVKLGLYQRLGCGNIGS